MTATFISTAILALAGLSILSTIVVMVLFLANKRVDRPENHPETQDDFHQSIIQWSKVMERRNK